MRASQNPNDAWLTSHATHATNGALVNSCGTVCNRSIMQAYGYFVLGRTAQSRGRPQFTASAAANGQRNHYAVLGVSQNASTSDIKRAYRLLALKYHPDVNKDVGANEAFKSIRLAYDILVKETTRNEYDRALQHQESGRRPVGHEWDSNPAYDGGTKFYKWAYDRRKMRNEKYWDQYYNKDEQFYNHPNKFSEKENITDERGSFIEVLTSAFLSLFLMQIVGIRLSLTFSSLMALTDRKLDAGYKFGYLFAWIFGGRGGILLTMFLQFASWVCGKTSSGTVALVVVALWFGSSLARHIPLPHGALVTLLYMSIKLQGDLN
ncbi:hypothetical protein F511_12179 [Dorcoceras hygrometricum]|uniref:J domain-containing protein n=1 Tax=Dorcoceras hygrometricum TaxID=472368 RepID=A0A2Z7C061_9LAMI|nr:hypothetical protein F511_12179 [Dorcoceras hygrometricum]